VGRVAPDISKDRGAFIFGIKQSTLVELIDREVEGSNSPSDAVSLARIHEYSAKPL
jgi:hypothetical protein